MEHLYELKDVERVYGSEERGVPRSTASTW